jgi:hypothetical protein
VIEILHIQVLPTVSCGFRENMSGKAWVRICGPTLQKRGQILISSTFKFILSDMAVTRSPPVIGFYLDFQIEFCGPCRVVRVRYVPYCGFPLLIPLYIFFSF